MRWQILIIFSVVLLSTLVLSLSNDAGNRIDFNYPTTTNYSLVNVNNSQFLDTHPASYFYEASNPDGFISSYSETDPYAYNGSLALNSSIINYWNSTIARTGNCPKGNVTMNITNKGVQCVDLVAGGSGNISGTGVSGRVAYFDGANTITGSDNLTHDSKDLNLQNKVFNVTGLNGYSLFQINNLNNRTYFGDVFDGSNRQKYGFYYNRVSGTTGDAYMSRFTYIIPTQPANSLASFVGIGVDTTINYTGTTRGFMGAMDFNTNDERKITTTSSGQTDFVLGMRGYVSRTNNYNNSIGGNSATGGQSWKVINGGILATIDNGIYNIASNMTQRNIGVMLGLQTTPTTPQTIGFNMSATDRKLTYNKYGIYDAENINPNLLSGYLDYTQYGTFIDVNYGGSAGATANMYGHFADITGFDNNWAYYSQGGDWGMESDNSKFRQGADTSNDYYQSWDGTNEVYNTSTGIAYFSSNVSATDFIDRTSVYDKSSGSSLDYARDSSSLLDSKGEINHSKFYGATTFQTTDFSKPVNITEKQEVCVETDDTECKETKIIDVIKTTYPFKIAEEGVSMSKELSLLRQQIYDLKELNTNLQTEDTRIKNCLKDSLDFKTYKECVNK